jgi:voltage-gated potassium channel Kch
MVLTLLTTLHFALFYMPGLACAFVLAERLRLSTPQFYAVVLASSCSLGYLAFWAYVGDPILGRAFSALVIAGSGLYCIVHRDLFWRGGRLQLWFPLIATFFLTLFYLGLGFLFGGLDQPLVTARVRFTHPLPVDNMLSLTFADILANEKPSSDFMGERWNMSDRPPLQAGITLLYSPLFGMYKVLQYQILGVLLQTSVLLGMWFFIDIFQSARLEKAKALLFVILSYFLLIHSFYTWPKLLPAGLVLIGYQLLHTSAGQKNPTDQTVAGVMIGTVFTLAMLGHGGTIFALIGIGLILLATRRLPARRILLAAVIAGAVLYLPWLGYQRYIDPPGDRLIKIHLGGQHELTSLSAFETIRTSYSRLSPEEILEKKGLNLAFVLWLSPLSSAPQVFEAFRSGALDKGLEILRTGFFFHLFLTIAIPLFGLFVVPFKLKKRVEIDVPESRRIFLVGIVGVLAWVLMLFGYPEAVAAVHHGSYFYPIVLMIAPVLVAGSYSGSWSFFLLLLQGLLFLLWIPLPPNGLDLVPARETLLANGFQAGFGLLALLAFLGLLSVLGYAAISPQETNPALYVPPDRQVRGQVGEKC